jgi:hypothetical protein
MSKTLEISEALYLRLEHEAGIRGLSIERLLEEWERNEADLLRRRKIVRGIDTLREQIFSQSGEMPDSVNLIREDRAR